VVKLAEWGDFCGTESEEHAGIETFIPGFGFRAAAAITTAYAGPGKSMLYR
jgi:hypothetical protein